MEDHVKTAPKWSRNSKPVSCSGSAGRSLRPPPGVYPALPGREAAIAPVEIDVPLTLKNENYFANVFIL